MPSNDRKPGRGWFVFGDGCPHRRDGMVQARLRGAERDANGPGDFRHRHAEEVVEDDERAPTTRWHGSEKARRTPEELRHKVEEEVWEREILPFAQEATPRRRGRRDGAAAAKPGVYTVRLRSGEMRKVHITCRATIGEVGNDEHNLRKIGKAGAQRWRGIRPTVRGSAMNPVDHPHGGGEGKAGQGNPHTVSRHGQKTKGFKTRNSKRTDMMIIRDRRQK